MRALLRIRAADVCAPAGFFIRPEKRMNVVRDDKRRVHVEYMNTRAAFIYTYLVFHVVEYTAAGIFLACLSLSLSLERARSRSCARNENGIVVTARTFLVEEESSGDSRNRAAIEDSLLLAPRRLLPTKVRESRESPGRDDFKIHFNYCAGRRDCRCRAARLPNR